MRLQPVAPPKIEGWDMTGVSFPCREIGGDYYDFIPLPGQRLGVLLGDVEGKGVAAALVMVKFSVEARVCLLTEPDLAAAVGKLNAVMNRVDLSDRFVTLAAVVLDPSTHTATLVNAGHPLPLLWRRVTGAVEEAAPVEASGPPIGLFEGSDYTCRQVRLEPGDGLVLFSDGVTEARGKSGDFFGEAGLADHLVRSTASDLRGAETLRRLVRRLLDFQDGPLRDDATLLLLAPHAGRVRGPGEAAGPRS
jgi:serine phosphatase RsbU (regulator of sigma subunit)